MGPVYSGVSSGQVSQVTYHLPSGLVNRVNGRDKSDSTTYKFNIDPRLCNGSTTDFDSVSVGSIPARGAM